MNAPRRRPLSAPAERTALGLAEIYHRHFSFVYQKAARLGGPGVDPEDVAQEVFLIVAQKLDTFDGTSLPTTWLYGITLNVVRAARRRLAVRRLFESRAGLEWERAPLRVLDSAEVVEAHRIAYEILDRMSAKKREVFILAEFEGLTCDEIAQIVGTKTETVWSRLHYARQEFEKRLACRRAGGRA
jgi:RNA polymerase sigma-70 factor (ECF subfamily)